MVRAQQALFPWKRKIPNSCGCRSCREQGLTTGWFWGVVTFVEVAGGSQVLDSPTPLPPSVTPACKHRRNNKAQIISSSIRNETPGKRGSLFAKWGWTGAIIETVLLTAQERCRMKQGDMAAQLGTQPQPYSPGCHIPPGAGSCSTLLLHPALLGVCLWGSSSRAVPCRAVHGLQQLFPWAGHGHAGRALCSKQHQRGERQLLILLSFLSSFNYRSYLSAENRKIVTITLHLPL